MPTDDDPPSPAHHRLADRIEQAYRHTDRTRSADRLRRALDRGCWIYGGGGYGRLIASLLADRQIPVHGFIDRRGAAARTEGDVLPIVAPDRFEPSRAADATLIVALHNFATPQKPILAWGEETGFAEILVPAELPDVLGTEAGSYWLAGRATALPHLAAIERVEALLADQASRSVLDGIVRFRVTGDIRVHPASHLPSQYFPDDVPVPRDDVRLVDGGAFTGDTYLAAATAGVRIAEWYAFEPDPANFAALVATAAATAVERAALYPCGLGADDRQIRFATGQNAGSHAADGAAGDTTVQIVALDRVLRGVRPTYVKLDIEGAERDALAGMRETLTRDRPCLAISVYHRPEDLWELPLLVHEMMPQADLYLRQHGANGFDTVLYAVTPAGD